MTKPPPRIEDPPDLEDPPILEDPIESRDVSATLEDLALFYDFFNRFFQISMTNGEVFSLQSFHSLVVPTSFR